MRPEESWGYTPREFETFVKLRAAASSGKLGDFLRMTDLQQPEETTTFESEKARLAGMVAAMRASSIDPSKLPQAFRMTPAEAADAANRPPPTRKRIARG